MPEIERDGVRLTYDVAGQGRPLVLLHGWSCNRGWWDHAGFVADLATDHQVVNLDLRGHGDSSCPHDAAAYAAREFVGDVMAVADAEGLSQFAVWGLSLGGWVGWHVGSAHPDRVTALVSSGSWDPRPEPREDLQEWWDTELAALREEGTAGLVAYRRQNYGQTADEITAWMEAESLASDPKALIAIQDPTLWDEGLSTIEDYPVPVFLISGELEDPENDAAGVAAQLPVGESLWLPGLGHPGACAASELTVPPARDFLQRYAADRP